MSLSKNNFLDLIAAEIEEFYGVIIFNHTEEQKIIYPIFGSFLGFFKKKLCVYFLSGNTINYQVHYYIFNYKILVL